MKTSEKQKLVADRVGVMLGDDIICNRCGATYKTMNNACTADLLDPCPGFRRIDEVQVPIERTVLEYEGERFVLTHPCKVCEAEIETGELCEQCTK